MAVGIKFDRIKNLGLYLTFLLAAAAALNINISSALYLS
jgi:hypothetical protein